MTKPITPSEVIQQKVAAIPDFVIEVFNELIAKHWRGNHARVLQKDVVADIVRLLENDWTLAPNITGCDSNAVYSQRWLDVEPVYQAAGWDVRYDKASYGESNFDAYFIFSRRFN